MPHRIIYTKDIRNNARTNRIVRLTKSGEIEFGIDRKERYDFVYDTYTNDEGVQVAERELIGVEVHPAWVPRIFHRNGDADHYLEEIGRKGETFARTIPSKKVTSLVRRLFEGVKIEDALKAEIDKHKLCPAIMIIEKKLPAPAQANISQK